MSALDSLMPRQQHPPSRRAGRAAVAHLGDVALGNGMVWLSGFVKNFIPRVTLDGESAALRLTLVPGVAGRELARELARDARFSAMTASSTISFFVLRQQ